jgi:hypothetical protein
MGTPSTITGATSNEVTSESHTHEIQTSDAIDLDDSESVASSKAVFKLKSENDVSNQDIANLTVSSFRVANTTRDGEWCSVAWSPKFKKFIACSFQTGTGVNRLTQSLTGENWSNMSSPVDVPLLKIIWVEELSKFICVGGSSDARIIYSEDGESWSNATITGNGAINDVVWSKELGLLVATSADASDNLFTSEDGESWVKASTPSLSLISVTWSKELGIFLAVQSGSTVSFQTLSSIDGQNWSSNTAPTVTGNRLGVVWVNHLNLFVIFRQGLDRLEVSEDGLNWSIPDNFLLPISSPIRGFYYIEKYKMLVLGTTTSVVKSFNIDYWPSVGVGTGAVTNITSAAYSEELNKVVLVKISTAGDGQYLSS